MAGSGFKYQKYSLGPNSYSDWKSLSDLGTLPAQNLLEDGVRHELWMPLGVESGQYAYIYKGYFYAPVTGEYSFSGYGDDNFGLYISDDYGTAEVNPTPYIFANSHMNHNDDLFANNISSVFGAGRQLEAGKYYYMELYHVNTGGNGFIKIRAEVPNADASLKFGRSQVMHIETSFTNQPEIIEFELDNVDASLTGTFALTLTRFNMATLQSTVQSTGNIAFNASAATFASKLASIDIFNKNTYGVEVKAYDDLGT